MMLKNDPYKPLTDSLIPLINGIGDPHFFLKRKSNLNNPTKGQKMENQKYNPLRFITLNRKIYIVSVLSKDIEDIQIGDQLLSFENKEVQTTTLLGNEDINKELNRILKDSMPVSFLRGKDTINTNFRLVSRIESIYKIPHRKYTLDEGIFYYKLNSWENIEYMYFHNAITENNDQQVKCIIFDLRNNGGGWETSAEKIASCFITRPHVYTHHSYTYNNNQMIKESWVIQPNANLRLTNIPVILLVNKNTVCASEAFCYFLKQNHPDTYIISNDEHTPGAYNSPSLISLFDDLLLRLVYQTFYVSDGSIIEKKGITPDIYVHYKNVFDLAAYNDKLLQTAKELANYLKK
jgi:C-terminal processing protease CtpA/Prc